MLDEMSESLAGKCVVITGASSGIGKALAKAFAKEKCKVVIASRRMDQLKEVQQEILDDIKDAKVHIVETDVVKRDQVKALIASAESTFGPVDVLINNAGIMPLSMMSKLEEDNWDKTIDINIKGVLNGVGAVLPGMLARKCGDIVNISSDAGRKVFPSGTVYCASKWAVEAITQGLRVENAGSGLRFLSVQPGATKTNLGSTITDPDAIEASKKFSSLMSFLEAEDVASAVVYALKAPRTVSLNEILIRPTNQGY